MTWHKNELADGSLIGERDGMLHKPDCAGYPDSVNSLQETALVVYSTLGPGEPDHWVLKKLGGAWYRGVIAAWEFDISWGAASGYKGVVPDPEGPECEVSVLVGGKLSKHWHEVDEFEGEGYRRVPVEVRLVSQVEPSAIVNDDAITLGSTIVASVYEAIQDNPD